LIKRPLQFLAIAMKKFPVHERALPEVPPGNAGLDEILHGGVSRGPGSKCGITGKLSARETVMTMPGL
jgi:hypothetical protein